MIVHEPDGILEIGQAGHSKASGIERLCASLGIAKEDTYAFGDSANDVKCLNLWHMGLPCGKWYGCGKECGRICYHRYP